MEQGLLIVVAIFAIYVLMAGGQKQPFGLTPRQQSVLDGRASGVADPDSARAWANTACGMVTDPGAQRSCARLASTCSPIVGEVAKQARLLSDIASSGRAPTAQEYSNALRAIAIRAPLCGAQMRTEGTSYADDFATLMKILTGNPDLDLSRARVGPNLLGSQVRAYLMRLRLDSVSINHILNMISNMAYLIPE